MPTTSTHFATSRQASPGDVPMLGPKQLPYAALFGGAVGISAAVFVTLRGLGERSLAVVVLAAGFVVSLCQFLLIPDLPVHAILLYVSNAVIGKLAADRLLLRPLSRHYVAGGTAHESGALIWLALASQITSGLAYGALATLLD